MKKAGRLLLHRLLHQEPDGSWTWRVRGRGARGSRPARRGQAEPGHGDRTGVVVDA